MSASLDRFAEGLPDPQDQVPQLQPEDEDYIGWEERYRDD